MDPEFLTCSLENYLPKSFVGPWDFVAWYTKKLVIGGELRLVDSRWGLYFVPVTIYTDSLSLRYFEMVWCGLEGVYQQHLGKWTGLNADLCTSYKHSEFDGLKCGFNFTSKHWDVRKKNWGFLDDSTMISMRFWSNKHEGMVRMDIAGSDCHKVWTNCDCCGWNLNQFVNGSHFITVCEWTTKL